MAKKVLVDINDTWKNVSKILVNINGTWKNVVKGLVNIAGVWKEFFSGVLTPSILQQVTITKSSSGNSDYHNSTYPVTLTGRKYHFENANVFEYRFASSSNGTSWTGITAWTTTSNPSYGSSSTVTYTLANSDFTSTTMYFRFEYRAFNTTYNTNNTSISGNVTVTYLEIPSPPSGFPSINQSTISVASTASSGTWSGSPNQYQWYWYYNDGSDKVLTYSATKTVSSISLSGTTATATVFDHGFKSGDSVSFSGISDLFNQSATTISSVFTNFFSYTVSKPTWAFATQYSVDNFVTYNGQIYKALLATPTRTDWSFSANYTTNTHVNYSSQVYKAIANTPTPRSNWNSSTTYTAGQYVNSGGNVWQATGTNINQTPTFGSDFWTYINIYPTGPYWSAVDIYPTSTTYWQSQNNVTVSGGSATGPNYYEGVSSSPVSYTINSFPSTDFKTGTSLYLKTTRMGVTASNIAGYSSTSYSSYRTIYEYPAIFFGAQTITSTTASIIYAEAYMDVYDIDVKTGGVSISGYPKTNQANSSPISITGLTGGTTYNIYVTPKNADTPRVSGVEKTTSFTTPSTPVNTSAPTITPLNNRSNAPISTSLTCSQGSWTGVNASTIYTYQWQYNDQGSLWLNFGETGNNTNTFTLPSYVSGLLVRCRVRATNGSISTDAFAQHTADAAVSVGAISPTTAVQNSATTFTSTITGYPTSYVIDWGDGTTTSAGPFSNTASVNVSQSKTYSSTGNRTITITAQPGSKTNSASVTVNPPAPTGSGFSLTNQTTQPTGGSVGTITTSSNVATINWTNASPTTSLRVQTSGAGTALDYSDTVAPFDTSRTVSYTSSGTISVTLTNFNANTIGRFSWNQSGAASYQINRTLGGSTSTVSGNFSGSSAFHDFTTSPNETLTINSIALWSGSNQTGSSTTYTINSTLQITTKTQVSTGSGPVTYVPPNVAPFGGSVTISLQSGTDGRVGATYAVTSASASGTPTPSVSGYQWQFFNLATSAWTSISGATSSTYTISYGNSTYSDIGRTIRCQVTFSNGVSPDLNTGSNSISVSNPTITAVTSSYSTAAPFCIWRVFGYNMQAITSKTIINGSQQTGNATSASTNSDATSAGISRQTSVGGSGSTYALIIRPEAFAGGGGALGTTVTTNTLTNNTTNRANSPVTNTFSPGGSV